MVQLELKPRDNTMAGIKGTKKNFPTLPRSLKNQLMKQIGVAGINAAAKQLDMAASNLSRLVNGNSKCRQSTIDRLTGVFLGNKSNSTIDRGMPTSTEGFTLRIVLNVKDAERLTAHCDIHSINPSKFVAGLVKDRLDSEWGAEDSEPRGNRIVKVVE